jgi:hypothetical protein
VVQTRVTLETRQTLGGRGFSGIGHAGQAGLDYELVIELDLARQTEAKVCWLARDVRMLVQSLSHDVLARAGSALATRQYYSISSSRNWRAESQKMNGAFARCVSRFKTNATICSPSPVFLTTN